MPSSSPRAIGRGSIVAPVADGGAQELRPVRRHVGVVRGRDVTDADGGDHDDSGEPAAVHLDEGDEALVADEQPGLAPDAARADREQRPRDVPPADDATADGRMNAVVVLRRQVGDEVGAALEARRGVGVAEERLELEEAPLGLQQLPRGRPGRTRRPCRRPAKRRVWASRRSGGPGRSLRVKNSSKPAYSREWLFSLAHVDAVDPREARQHRCTQTRREPRLRPNRSP